MRSTRWLLLAFAVAAVASVAVGVGMSSAATKAKGSIVVFMPPGTDNYLAEWQKGARGEAKALGYDIKIIENKFDQTEQDNQVRQQLSSGSKPSVYIWWPVDNKAGVASLRALGTSGVPTIMTNQYPLKGTDKWWVAYAGVNDFLNAQVSADLMTKARAEQMKKGVKLHSAGGNTLIIKFTAGYSAGDDRDTAFKAQMKKNGVNLNILAEQNAGFGETDGYKIGSQMIAANKSKGIDFFYAENDALATGVIQALKEAGFQPGKNVIVVGGTCHGNLKDLTSGAEYGTGLQAARLEGQWSVIVANRYLTGGKKVKGGQYYAPADPAKAPPATGPVMKYMFIPNPPVLHGAASISTTRLWGVPMTKLCTY
jgi:ABC-type sugar transport system substrate-binding protein